MARPLQAPTTRLHSIKTSPPPPPCPLAPAAGNVGLRRPSDRFALKSSFFSPSLHLLVAPLASAAPRFSMRVASKQSYICRDCGYIYNDRTPFEKLADSYFCPVHDPCCKLCCAVCGAPKRRFRSYAPVPVKNANATDVRKTRKAQIQRDEAIGRALPIGIVVGIVALAGLYFYLNNTV